ncbi:MAG: FAD-binding protein [Candidatus Lokiarchaeota archaeon]|nr:FAD-binding protein [Candidatus Lokiarchaeota archaeon]MBD3340029.1 FAD-binding protein [Candidatus Lokiarchaeota archaeon]
MKYNKISKALLEKFKKIVGEQNCISEYAIRWTYAFGPTIFEKNWVPDLVIIAQSTDQVSKILRLANKEKIAVTPRGSGTSLSAGHLTSHGGVMLDLSQMDDILSVDIVNNMVEVEPGVICDDLNEDLKPYGYFFPPDPGSSSICTIGGMVATNAGGVQAFKYGVTKDYVLTLEVILPNGEILRLGAKVLKSVSSYNMKDLIVGSEGTLGVITKVGLRIRPLPKFRKLGFFVYDQLEKVSEAVIELRKRGIVPNMLEFIDDVVIRVVYDYLGDEYKNYPVGYVLIAEVDGRDTSQVDHDFSLLFEIFKNKEPRFYKVAETDEERDILIKARKASLPATSRIKSFTCTEDCSIPITEFSATVKKIKKIPKKIGSSNLSVGITCHMEGNLHPKFLFNENNPKDVKDFQKAMDYLYNVIILPIGGSLTGEHGIGKVKTPYLASEHPETVVNLMKDLKLLFDPNEILSPGQGKGLLTELPRTPTKRTLENQPNKILTFNCMRCGLCAPSCVSKKVYRLEAFSPRGRLSILNGLIFGDLLSVNSAIINKILHTCTLCGECKTQCPAGVITFEIFEKAREILHHS